MNVNSNFIADDAVLRDCVMGNNIKIYKNSEVSKSNIGNYVTIGDSAIVLESKLSDHISINRRNYIFRSEIGCYTYTGINTMLRSSKIGNFCSLSWNISIGGGDHPQDKVTTSNLNRFYQLDAGNWNDKAKLELNKTFKNLDTCTIGNDVLISTNVTVLRNLKVGNGAIIGAGAVVTKDVEPYSIVVGIPAKKIKMRFDDKTIEALEEIQWWSWPIDIIRQNLELIYSTKVNKPVLEKLFEISNSIKSK